MDDVNDLGDDAGDEMDELIVSLERALAKLQELESVLTEKALRPL